MRTVLVSSLSLLAGCVGPSEVIAEHTAAVGGVVVHETIVREPSLHHPVFERRYEVRWGGASRDVGGYRDENDTGMILAPFRRGDTLVLTSGAHVALVGPLSSSARDASVRWFSPYDAPCFARWASDHAEGGSEVNGHYDVIALEATVEGDHVRLTYGPRPDRAPPRGELDLVFDSDDAGRSYDCE
jgi:hypothetical protein